MSEKKPTPKVKEEKKTPPKKAAKAKPGNLIIPK